MTGQEIDALHQPDKILLLCDEDSAASEIVSVLSKRDYSAFLAKSWEQAEKSAAEGIFDLLLVNLRSAFDPVETVETEIKKRSSLSRMAIVVLNTKVDEECAKSQSSGISVIGGAFNPTKLLVKVATQLRMRKLRSEQAGFASKIAEQNSELRELNNRFKRDILEAREIQASLFPKALPTAPLTAFAAYCVPLEDVGGDLYHIWKIDRGVYGLFIGDAAGHGLPAALIGAMTKMALTYANNERPDQMFAQINQGLVDHITPERFVTAAGAVYRPHEASLQLVRAGHPSPLIWRKNTGGVETVVAKGLPLGLEKTAVYEMHEVKFEPGDKLLMYTDGITEAADMDGRLFGVDGITEIFLEVAPNQPIGRCIELILEKHQHFAAGRMLKDDITLIGLEYAPNNLVKPPSNV